MKIFTRFLSLFFSIFLLNSITPIQAQWDLLPGWALINPSYTITGNDFTVTSSGKVLVVTEWDGVSPHNYGLVVAGRRKNGGGWYLSEDSHVDQINFIKGLDNGLVIKHYANRGDNYYANTEIRVSVDDGQTYGPDIARTGDGGFIASDMIDENNGLALHTYAYPSKSTSNSASDWPLGHLIRIIDGEAQWIQAFGLFFYNGSIELVNDTTAYLLSKISSTKTRADNQAERAAKSRLVHVVFAQGNIRDEPRVPEIAARDLVGKRPAGRHGQFGFHHDSVLGRKRAFGKQLGRETRESLAQYAGHPRP